MCKYVSIIKYIKNTTNTTHTLTFLKSNYKYKRRIFISMQKFQINENESQQEKLITIDEAENVPEQERRSSQNAKNKLNNTINQIIITNRIIYEIKLIFKLLILFVGNLLAQTSCHKSNTSNSIVASNCDVALTQSFEVLDEATCHQRLNYDEVSNRRCENATFYQWRQHQRRISLHIKKTKQQQQQIVNAVSNARNQNKLNNINNNNRCHCNNSSWQDLSPVVAQLSTKATAIRRQQQQQQQQASTSYASNGRINMLSTLVAILFMALALNVPTLVNAGACWRSIQSNGKCSEIYLRNSTKTECCRYPELFYTDRDVTDVEFFFATTVGDGMTCSPCALSCKSMQCGWNKKCVKRKGRPKCVCAPECGAAKRRNQKAQQKIFRGHEPHSEQLRLNRHIVLGSGASSGVGMRSSAETMSGSSLFYGEGKSPRDIRSLSSEITNFNVGVEHQMQMQNQNQRKMIIMQSQSQKPQLNKRLIEKTGRLFITANVEHEIEKKPVQRRLQIFSNVRRHRNRNSNRDNDFEDDDDGDDDDDNDDGDDDVDDNSDDSVDEGVDDRDDGDGDIDDWLDNFEGDVSLGNQRRSSDDSTTKTTTTTLETRKRLNLSSRHKTNKNSNHNNKKKRRRQQHENEMALGKHIKQNNNNNNNFAVITHLPSTVTAQTPTNARRRHHNAPNDDELLLGAVDMANDNGGNNNNNNHNNNQNNKSENGSRRHERHHHQQQWQRKRKHHQHKQQQHQEHQQQLQHQLNVHHQQNHRAHHKKHKNLKDHNTNNNNDGSSVRTRTSSMSATSPRATTTTTAATTIPTTIDWQTTIKTTTVATTAINSVMSPSDVDRLLNHGSYIAKSSSSPSSLSSSTATRQKTGASTESFFGEGVSADVSKSSFNFDESALLDGIYDNFNVYGFPNRQYEVAVENFHGPHPVCGTDGRTYNTECQLKKRACRTNNPSLAIAYRGHCRTSCNGVKCLNGHTCVEDQYAIPHCITCKIDCPEDDAAFVAGLPIDPTRAVCGVDGKTYRSVCDINRRICKIGRSIAIAYPSPCRADRPTCNEINCGHKHTCLVDLLTHEPRCVSCSYKCARKRHPTSLRFEEGKICGVNNRTYNSWCELRRDSCNTGFLIDIKLPGECH